MNICLICLRTDRLLKLASDVLEEFHDELCEFSIITMASSCYYCSECEYILTKFYKFKQKCEEALKIYKKWKSTKKKQPINLLYTLLPPSPLGIWKPNPKKIGNFTIEATDSQIDVCEKHELIKDNNPIECKQEFELEFDHTYSNDDNNTFADLLKIENIAENISKSEFIDEIQNDGETEDCLFDNLEEPLDDSDKCINLNVIKHEPEDCDDETKMTKTKKLPIKKNPAKNEIIIENELKSKKRPSKKKIARIKAQLDRAVENDKMYKSVFDIEYLTTHEMKLEEFQRRKTYECYVNAEHKCEICYQGFKNSKHLEYHTKNWHNETAGTVCCPICRMWTRKTSFHRLTHTVVFKCKLCPLITYRRTSVQNHFDSHKGKQYHCEQCDITYKSKSAYLTHVGKAHRLGRHVCESCGRGFYSPHGLKMHKNKSSRCTVVKETTVEPKETTEGVRCDECDVTLPSQQVYDAHIADVHVTVRCMGPSDITGGVAGLPGYRTRRLHVQNSSKVNYVRRKPKQTCRVCHKVGPSFAWLKLHFKREHPDDDMNILYADKKKHLCDICGTGFSGPYALRDHMNLHTGALPHACDICPKRFRSALVMRDHRLRHFPSALPCTHCGKLFKTSSNLSNHMRTHTGERDYKCELCGKGFLLGASLNEHIRGVHYNIRRVKKRREGATDTGPRKIAKRGKRMIAEKDTDSDLSSDSRV